jgi:hypothetical protein
MNRVCGKNLARAAILQEIEEFDSDEAFAPRKIAVLWAEFRKLARIAISYCHICKRLRYSPTDAQCSCAPALDENKQPIIAGYVNRHMQRSSAAKVRKMMKDFRQISQLRMKPIKSIKFSEELKNAQQSKSQASEDQGQAGKSEASE